MFKVWYQFFNIYHKFTKLHLMFYSILLTASKFYIVLLQIMEILLYWISFEGGKKGNKLKNSKFGYTPLIYSGQWGLLNNCYKAIPIGKF